MNEQRIIDATRQLDATLTRVAFDPLQGQSGSCWLLEMFQDNFEFQTQFGC